MNSQQHHEHQHKARRLRGGGAGRVRLLFHTPLPEPNPRHSLFAAVRCSAVHLHHDAAAAPPTALRSTFPSYVPNRLSADPDFPFSPHLSNIGLLHWASRMLHLLRYVSRLTRNIAVSNMEPRLAFISFPTECCKVRLSLPVSACLPSSSLLASFTSPVFPHYEYFSFDDVRRCVQLLTPPFSYRGVASALPTSSVRLLQSLSLPHAYRSHLHRLPLRDVLLNVRRWRDIGSGSPNGGRITPSTIRLFFVFWKLHAALRFY